MLLIEVSVPSDFCLNNTKIKKMTKYQGFKNEVKRSWKLKNAKIFQGNAKEEPHKDPTNHPWEH